MVQKFHLESIVFTTGGVVMILEIIGSRVVAPFLGTSLFIWTSLIGVILGCLSIGYAWGGRLADKNPSYKTLGLIIFLASLSVVLLTLTKAFILDGIQIAITDIRVAGLVSATVLFGPTGVLLGMVSPYAIKLKLQRLGETGATVGSLYAISTVGSIVGTFLAGFVLLAHFQVTDILWFLALVLLVASIAASKNFSKKAIALGVFIVFGYAVSSVLYDELFAQNIVIAETPYQHIEVFEVPFGDDQRPLRALKTGRGGTQSGMYIDNPTELAFAYTKYYDLYQHYKPDTKRTLIIGGAGYSYPKHFLATTENATMDVVEIDPGMTVIAKQYFELKDDERLTIYHEDARTFFQKSTGEYDTIFIDAFHDDNAIPYHLTTRDFFETLDSSLAEDGVVIINMISAIDGDTGKFFRAEHRTLSEVFAHVSTFRAQPERETSASQNLILLASQSGEMNNIRSQDPRIESMLDTEWFKEVEHDIPVLTDEFAPVEYLTLPIHTQ